MNQSISESAQGMPAEQPGMTFFIPCKANNAPLLVEAVQCIRWSTPEAGIVVLDDERAPCPQTVKEVLRPLSVPNILQTRNYMQQVEINISFS